MATQNRSMTEGGIARSLFLFTLPIMAGNFLQQLYNTVDGIVVGQFISESALAAVGTCAPVTVLLIALAIGLSTGSGIIVAQYYGAKKKEDLLKSVSTSLILLFVIGLALTFIGMLIAAPLLKYVLAVPEAELGFAVYYLRIYCVGLVFQFIYNIVSAILRAFGDSKAMLYFLLVSSVSNILLDLVFVIALRMGVGGAAWATVIAQALSAVMALIYMFRKYEDLRFTRETLVFDPEKCSMALKMGIPTTLQQCVISGGNMALQRLVNSFGVSFMAGYTAGIRVESYLVIPSLGFAIGLSTFTGQNIGAGKIERVYSGYRKTLLMSVASCIVLSLLVLLFRKPLVLLFGLDGQALEMGMTYLLMAAPCFVLFGIYQTAIGTLQGAGDVMYTMFCTLSSLVVRVIVSYMLAGAISYKAMPVSMLIAWIYVTVISYVRYRNCTWLSKAVVSQEG